MKKEIKLLGIGIFLLVMIGVVSAAPTVTLISPSASSTISGTTILNVSVTSPTSNFTCKFYAKSSSTANNTWSLLATQLNTTATTSNTTFDSTVIEDSNDYIFNATCYNDTDTWGSDTNTGITVDNTIPQAPTLSPSTNTLVTSATTQTFTGTVADENTTGCTYVIGRGGTSLSSEDTTSGTATYSGTTCTFTKTFSDQSDNGDWYWYITASDGSNTTDSVTNVLQVQIAPSSGSRVIKKKSPLAIVDVGDGKSNYLLWGAVIAIVVLFIYVTKRKGR